jgi:DNA transformation protein and related proteins
MVHPEGSNAFVDYLLDLLASLGSVSARRMFGGYGIYHEGVMFGLVADDTLYLKADAENVGLFEAEGLPAFKYGKGGKSIRMSYFLAPPEMMDDPEAAARWARRSIEAALRAQVARNR